MSYQVLARKWRPHKFAELVGQEHVVRALTHALDTGRMHHAYLFTGTRGVGKTTIARIFAKSLNCERGESADPCGVCAVCTAVDTGRFVDLLEIDAASNTGVDDVREVIENAQYAPSRGRFKVYLIDEVHMLSKPAFNALLKTLEEPPGHVKFLLATTDPQKLPVTVLSRCLKFNLKRLLPEQISGQMQHILAAEQISFEDEALAELARAADGSMRDGLSLLDQAIAYGGGQLTAAEVRAMLGSVERSHVLDLIRALAAGDGVALLAEAARIASFAPDFGGVLDELALLLHRIQLLQLVPGHIIDEDAALEPLAQALSPEDVQLYYQIATGGRQTLGLAPDLRTGFEMSLLRMLAFRPADETTASRLAPPAVASRNAGSVPAPRSSATATPAPAPVATSATPVAPPVATLAPLVEPAANNAAPAAAAAAPAPATRLGSSGGLPSWDSLIEQAQLRGPMGQLAQNAALQGRDGATLTLSLQAAHMHLAVEPIVEQMEVRLNEVLGERIKLRFVAQQAAMTTTPAARAAQQREAAQQAAKAAIENDPLVDALKRDFDARVLPQSVRPLKS